MPGDPSFHLFSNTLTFRARPSGGAAFLLSECRSAPGADAPPSRARQGAGTDQELLAGRLAVATLHTHSKRVRALPLPMHSTSGACSA